MVTGVGPADTQAPSTPNPFSRTGGGDTSIADELGRVDRQRRRERVPALPRRPRGGDDGRDEPHVRGPPLRHLYAFGVEAFDAAGNASGGDLTTATNDRDTTPPSVTLTAPLSGATVSSSITVAADAADNDASRASASSWTGRRSARRTRRRRTRSSGTPARPRTGHTRSGRSRATRQLRDLAQVTVTVANSPTSAEGLVAALAFDEGTGTAAADDSGNGNSGTLSGAKWAVGRHGTAVSLDGVDDW